jgi:hypothetical protein
MPYLKYSVSIIQWVQHAGILMEMDEDNSLEIDELSDENIFFTCTGMGCHIPASLSKTCQFIFHKRDYLGQLL